MYELYHETNFFNLESILRDFILFRSSNYKPEFKIGQGSVNRRLTQDPTVSIVNSDFFKFYDEVDGVYFRLKRYNYKKTLETSDCCLIFSGKILSQYNNVINTEENFGFMIDKNGVENESQFSGEMGMSILNMQNIEKLEQYSFDFERSEVVVLNDVDLKFLKYILIKKKFKNLSRKIVKFCENNNIKIIFV